MRQVVAELRRAQTAQIFFRHVGTSAIRRTRLAVVDAAHFEAGLQVVPSRTFIRV